MGSGKDFTDGERFLSHKAGEFLLILLQLLLRFRLLHFGNNSLFGNDFWTRFRIFERVADCVHILVLILVVFVIVFKSFLLLLHMVKDCPEGGQSCGFG